MQIVESTNLGNATPAQTGRAGGLQAIDSAGKNSSAPRKGASSTDSVELSSFADRLSRTMQASTASRAQRITELTAAVSAGSYQVDSRAVSHSMVSQAMSSSSGGTI